MRFVAVRDFRNNCGLEIKGALHPDHVHKGAVFSIGSASGFELLTQSQRSLVSQLRSAGCICDADDTERVKFVRAEVATEQRREKRTKSEPWTRAHRLQVAGIIVALLGILFYGSYRVSHPS